jgi:hypothetical protein
MGALVELIKIPVVFGVQSVAQQGLVEVVSDHMQLTEAAPEGLGGRQTVNVPQTEYVIVLDVLQGVLFNVQQSVSRLGEPRLDQKVGGLGRHQRVEVVVVLYTLLPALQVLEGCPLTVLVHA